ncbi:MAG TPA: hypothetical protein VEP66_18835 [Myxococcales bacterium]|nr:hypothetical protein [Myxococcales bacterium]
MRLAAVAAAVLIAVALARPVRANSVTNEVFVTSAQTSDANPRALIFTDSLTSSFDLGEDWSLTGGFSLTLPGRTPAATEAQFDETSQAITFFTLALDWSATDNLTLGVTGDFSPASTQFAGAPISLRQADGTELVANAEIRSRTSHLAAGFDAWWDTFGHSDLEWTFTGGLTVSSYDIDQGITRIRTANGTTLTAQELIDQTNAYCAAHPRRTKCGQNVLNALKATPSTLSFERLSAGATARLFQDTDLTLLGDYYVYNQDPSQVGYFGLAAVGREAGLPIAPLRYLIRPEVAHRFGDLTAKVWVQAGEYVTGTAETTAAIGLRMQYKFSKAFRAWLTVSGQRDVDENGNDSRFGTVSGGLGLRW